MTGLCPGASVSTSCISASNYHKFNRVNSSLLAQVFVACAALTFQGKLGTLKQEWSISDAMKGSALPATIYAVQNSLIQLSYRHLDSLTCTMLNQTKLVFTALFMFLILG